jgi:hypothetical protein
MNEYPEGFVEWLANGERGLSSNTMATILSEMRCMTGTWMPNQHPHDPSDFIRCEKLLQRVPEFALRFNLMKSVSPQWKVLVENWEAIRLAINIDCQTGYNLIQRLLAEAK